MAAQPAKQAPSPSPRPLLSNFTPFPPPSLSHPFPVRPLCFCSFAIPLCPSLPFPSLQSAPPFLFYFIPFRSVPTLPFLTPFPYLHFPFIRLLSVPSHAISFPFDSRPVPSSLSFTIPSPSFCCLPFRSLLLHTCPFYPRPFHSVPCSKITGGA